MRLTSALDRAQAVEGMTVAQLKVKAKELSLVTSGSKQDRGSGNTRTA